MTYHCTKCDWSGDEPFHYQDTLGGGDCCPLCGDLVEDLDLQERIAIRMDADQSEKEATEKAKAEIERWKK